MGYNMSCLADNNVAYFAETVFRGRRTLFGIKLEDRLLLIYVIG